MTDLTLLLQSVEWGAENCLAKEFLNPSNPQIRVARLSWGLLSVPVIPPLKLCRTILLVQASKKKKNIQSTTALKTANTVKGSYTPIKTPDSFRHQLS